MKSLVKKYFALLLAAALVITGMNGLPVYSQSVLAADNVPEGYIPVYTISDLYGIRNNLSGNYILMNDIDLTEATQSGGSLDTGHGWTPIDNFNGTLDGNGYRIKGMNIYYDDIRESGNYGLFGYLEGSVKRLGLTDVNINLVNNAQGSVYSNNIFSCGAVAGYAQNADIEECFAEGKITVTGDSDIDKCVGGICGISWETKNCYSNMDINTNIKIDEAEYLSWTGVGGIVGWGEADTCYNRGNVDNATGGAISGYIENKNKNCIYLNGTGIGNYDNTDTPLTETQMKDANFYTNFDFSNVWELDSDCIYPYPQLRSCRQIRLTKLAWAQIPVKTEYNQGDVFDTTGGILNYTYEDGTSSSGYVIEQMIAGYDMMQIGKQIITVRKGNMAVTYTINVNPIPVAGISLNQTELYMEKGDTETLAATVMPANATDRRVEWSSSNSSVAIVDQTGKITALNNGEADIVAKASNGLQSVCHVKVLIFCNYIDIDTDSLAGMYSGNNTYAFPKGSLVQLHYAMYPDKSTESVKWIVDDNSIVKINEQNIMRCLKTGTTRITICTDSGKKDSILVKVIKVKGINLKKVKGLKITASKKKLTIKWKKAAGARAYYVQIAQDKKFTKGVKSYKVSGTKIIFKGKRKKKYYVRVSTYAIENGIVLYGKYSAIKSKKTK